MYIYITLDFVLSESLALWQEAGPLELRLDARFCKLPNCKPRLYNSVIKVLWRSTPAIERNHD